MREESEAKIKFENEYMLRGLMKTKIYIIPKLSDFILYTIVAAGFLPDYVIQAGSLRFSSFGEPV